MNSTLIEITSFSDFDVPTTLCLVSGTPTKSMLDTNKDFITWLSIKFISQIRAFKIHSVNTLDITIVIDNEIKKVIFENDGKFTLPSRLIITPNDYLDFLLSIGFKEVKTLKICTNSN